LRHHKIPYFTNSPSDIERGAFLGLGADYVEVGRSTGEIAQRVMMGEDPKDIPIRDYVPEKMRINLALAREYGFTIPTDLLERAASVKE